MEIDFLQKPLNMKGHPHPPAPPSPVITPVALPRSLQTLLLSKPLLLQPFLPFPSPTPAHQWLPFHEPPAYLPNDLLQTGEVARMKPRMVSLAGATALLLNSMFWCSSTTSSRPALVPPMVTDGLLAIIVSVNEGLGRAHAAH